MLSVTLSSTAGAIPWRCACCGAPPTTTLKAQKSRGLYLVVAVVQTTFAVPVPYCAACAAHVKAFQGAGLSMPAVLLGAGTIFVALMLGEAWGLGGGQQLAAMVGAPAVLVGGLLAWRRRQRATAAARMRGYHALPGPAVTVEHFDDATVTLACADLEFARALAEANRTVRPIPV